MLNLLKLALSDETPACTQGETTNLYWHWLATGLLELQPKRAYHQAVVLSAGIHGNETAPIELLNQLVEDLLRGKWPLAVRLLVVLGNPGAIRAGQRYLDHDINRLFGGRHQQIPLGEESRRAQQLEHNITAFFATETRSERLHYDLHTAIRGSLHPQFALLPCQPQSYSANMLRWLQNIELDALVMHTAAGGTFAHFSSEYCAAASCTLELGKALPFGQNQLEQFNAVNCGLQALVSGEPELPRHIKPPMVLYRVVKSLIKHDAHFRLLVADDVLNFTQFSRGVLVTQQARDSYRVEHPSEWILFPNPHVEPGLRAGIMLIQMAASELPLQGNPCVIVD